MRTATSDRSRGADAVSSDRSARRSLGQNFLVDGGAVRKIVALVAGADPRGVLEIGPGRGALTDGLAALGVPLVAVEKDERFAGDLGARFAGSPHVTIWPGDALALPLDTALPAETGNVAVGNLPYNAAAPIFFRLLGLRQRFARFVLMFQREVAERIAAAPGSSAYGAVSVLSRWLTETRIALRLGPRSFRPAPKVHSAVVVVVPRQVPLVGVPDEAAFAGFVRAVFTYRRKTLGAALRAARLAEPDEARRAVQACGLPATARAQELDVPLLAALHAALTHG